VRHRSAGGTLISGQAGGGRLCAKLLVDGMDGAVQCQQQLADVSPSLPEVSSSRDRKDGMVVLAGPSK